MKKPKAKQSIKPKASGLYDSSRRYNRKLTPYVVQSYDTDHNANVSDYDLSAIRSKSRELYANTPAVRSGIGEIADYSIGDAWNVKCINNDKVTEEWINSVWMPVIDWKKQLRIIVKSILRDGDILVVLTENANGFPGIQLIPAHKIQSGKNTEKMLSGPYAGRAVIKGAIFNSNGQTIAYNIVNEGKEDYQISVLNCFLASEMEDPQQVRGEPALKSCINKWQDIETVIAFELQGIKSAAGKALIINAPSVAAHQLMDDSENPLQTYESTEDAAGTTRQIPTQELRGGEVIVFDNSQGVGEIKQVDTTRPTQNVQAFLTEITRHAMLALRWPIEFSVNLDMGGATARTIALKVDKRISEIQEIVLLPLFQRVVKYAISKAADNGFVTPKKDWWKIVPTYPRSFVYEQYKDVKSSLELYRLGIITAEQLCAAEGYDYTLNLESKFVELKRAHDMTDKQPVSFAELIQLTPNLNGAPPPNPTQTPVKE